MRMTLMPGFEAMATKMMRKTMKKKGIARVEELRDLCVEPDVKLVACHMTVDLFDYAAVDFIPEIQEWVGAASFLPPARPGG
jgi:peroxiredoxin family protein